MRTVRLFVAGLFAMLVGSAASAAACDGFTDVDSGNTTYCSAVTYLKDHEITLGCTGTTYCPNDYVTRLQMALFLQRMSKHDGSNTVTANDAAVAGGTSNTASNTASVVGGGNSNVASGYISTVTGGAGNYASGFQSTVLGGIGDTASGFNSLALGGAGNTASGSLSIAMGEDADADLSHCMVINLWGTFNHMNCIGSTSIVRIGNLHGFSVDYYSQRPDGGGTRWFGVGDIFPGQTISTWTGGYLSDAGVWVNGSSSKVSKTEFEDVDALDVLDKVAKIPITTWRYKQGEGDVRHIGPMAEDFWESFGVGYGPQTIADLDARGVALAAIQGLHARGLQKDARIAALEREMAEVRAQIAALTR